MSNYTPKTKIIEFIRQNTYPKPNDINEVTTLRQLKNMLQIVIKNREQDLVEEGVHHDYWIDDEILGEAQDYMDELDENRLANEEKNINFTRDVSLATQNTKLPIEIHQKIMSYGLEEPGNPTDLYKTIKKTGGKSKSKSRSKSRRNKKHTKNTRKHRKLNRKTI